MEATLSGEVGADFTAEHLRGDVGCEFGLEDFEGGPIVQVIGLNGSSGDDPDEKPVRGVPGDGVDGKIEAIEVFIIVIPQGGDDPSGQGRDLLSTERGERCMIFHHSADFVESNGSKGDEPVNFTGGGDIPFSKSLFRPQEIVPEEGIILLVIRGTGIDDPFHLIRRDGISYDLKMRMEDTASSREEEVLADLPEAGMGVVGHRLLDDFNGY
jgi:hypothetical protein